MTEKKKTGGLAGVTAGKTALCTVGKEGAGLTYCGYDIYDLADNASFEEVAMDVLRTAVSFLGNIEPEGNFSNQQKIADQLLACLPSMMAYWHRFHSDGVRIETETDDNTVAGHILHAVLPQTEANFVTDTLNVVGVEVVEGVGADHLVGLVAHEFGGAG